MSVGRPGGQPFSFCGRPGGRPHHPVHVGARRSTGPVDWSLLLLILILLLILVVVDFLDFFSLPTPQGCYLSKHTKEKTHFRL